MTRFWRLISVGLLLVCGIMATTPAAADNKPDADRIAQLIHQLGSRKFSAREAASKALDQIGEPALEALKTAAQSADPEIRARAEKLVKAIGQRVQSSALLAPKRLRLTFKETPVEQAVAEFSKQSGYTMRLVGDKNTWANRTVTLDTGDTTFWRAFDAFCDKAHLVEAPPEPRFPRPPQHLPMTPAVPALPAAPRPPIKGGAAVPAAKAVLVLQLAPPRGAARPLPVMKIRPGFMASPSNELRLKVGEPTQRPTSYFGAIRIRTASMKQPTAAGKQPLLLGLEVTPEPRLRVWNVVNVRIDKAIDDQDQRLAAFGRAPGSPQMVARRAYPLVNNHVIAVQLQAGEKPTKTLKQLKGVINSTVRDEDKVLLTMDDLLKAANKTVKSPTAGSVTVNQVTENTDGTFTVQVDMKYASGVLPATQLRPSASNRPGVRRPGPSTLYLGLTTLDANGTPIPISHVSTRAVGGGADWKQRVILTLKPKDGQGKPAKLTFSGSRMVTVTVPFELSNVPLS